MHADCNEICPPPCPNALKTAAIITIQKLLEYPINPNEKALTRSEGTTISSRSVLYGLNTDQLMDFQDTYNAGYGYGLGVRTLIQPEKGNHNGSLGAFGWTGGFGTWAEADPSEGLSIVYMHNQIPNEELYVHHRVRTAVYGLIE